MIFHTTRFGDVDYPEDKCVNFPEGLLGFEKETRFAFLPFTEEEDCPLEWMQSVHTAELAFVVTDPHHFLSDYSIKLENHELCEIGLQPQDIFALRVIVTIPENYINMTANLVGPLVFNANRMIAKQFVITSLKYDTKHYLFPEDVRKSSPKIS